MVKKIIIFFAYTLFFVSALIYFTPKSSLYFFLEEQLKEHDVIISKEEVNDNGFILNLKGADISYKSIDSATVDNADIKLLLLYNSINLKGITLCKNSFKLIPLVVLTHTYDRCLFR